MPFERWEDAVVALRRKLEPPTSQQRRLAESVGLQLPVDIRSPVAGALLRDHLAEPLRGSAPRPPSDTQLEYFADIVADITQNDMADEGAPGATHELVSAWIEVALAKRAVEALELLRPEPGDVVRGMRRSGEVIGTVISISADATINLAGLPGRGLDAHRAVVVARVGEESSDATRARRRADNFRAARPRRGVGPSIAGLQMLEQYRVAEPPEQMQIDLLREAIAEARDERPIQRVLTEHPALVAALVRSSYGTFVIPQASLGGRYRPDFLVAAADTLGIHWHLVELESPLAAMGQQGGGPAVKTREAMKQVDDWREWLGDNVATAQRSREANGLGLPDIRPESPAYVFISRRDHQNLMPGPRRLRIIERQAITIHTYDWLVDAVDPHYRAQRPGGPVDWGDWAIRE
jgi:hypothetical protein